LALVRHPYNSIKRGGGGSGYLYNLRAGAEQFGASNDVRFEVSESIINPKPPVERPPSLVKRVVGRLRYEVLSAIRPRGVQSDEPRYAPYEVPADFDERYKRRLIWVDERFGWMDEAFVRGLFECDLLFANELWMASIIQHLCPSLSREKLVIIPHSPTWPGTEQAADVLPDLVEELLVEIPSVRALNEQHLEVMANARAVMWPCAGAIGGYPEWDAETVRGAGLNVFGETGVLSPEPNMSTQQLRAQWGVLPHQRVILFIGRAHQHKGFDRFVDWADHYRSFNYEGKDDRYVFIHAGATPATKRDLSSIRHVGYITDNGAAYVTADLLVIPNRYSYLDIGLLEAMSLGAKIAISPTGGHGVMAGICPELCLIPGGTPEEVLPALIGFADEYASDSSRSDAFKALWKSRFSLQPFYENHVRVVNQLIS